MAYVHIDPISGEPPYYEDDEAPPPYAEPEKKNWGGKRREGITKESANITLDVELWKWIDSLGGKRSTQLNKIVKAHKEHIEQMIKDVGEENVL